MEGWSQAGWKGRQMCKGGNVKLRKFAGEAQVYP